jgi:hypothetical protein
VKGNAKGEKQGTTTEVLCARTTGENQHGKRQAAREKGQVIQADAGTQETLIPRG